MGQTLAERIQYEAAYDRNLIFQAYAGDLADLVGELQARAERAEAALEKLREECNALSNHIMDSEIFQPDDLAAIARCVWRKTSLSRDGSSIPGDTESDLPEFWYSACGHLQYASPSHEWKHCPYCGFSIWSDYPSESLGELSDDDDDEGSEGFVIIGDWPGIDDARPSDNESLTIGIYHVYHVDIPLYTNEGACYGSRLLFEGSLDECMGHGGDGRRICNSADNPVYFYDSNSGTWEPSDWEPSDNDLLSPDAGTEDGAA